ncbi:MAG: Gfo/Idh/MocA family oxidoreductase [Rhodospirillales bacterium]|nr:Gfo/Idh/MocA family oxidoreductase [Rhodospirillales bacterium]
MSDRPFKVAVAGLGFGAGVHVPAFRAVPGVEVVAIAGRDRARAEEAAARLDIPCACAGLDELLDRELDAVSLALPPAANESALVSAFGVSGLAVFSEKPLGASAERVQALAARSAGRTIAVDFEFTELATFRELKRCIDERSLGRIVSVEVEWLTHSWAQRSRSFSWKTDAEQGGGALALLGSHVLYLAEWMFGPIERVATAVLESEATGRFTPPGRRAAPDTVTFSLMLHGDVPLRALVSNASPAGPLHRWTVVGEGGKAVLENRSTDYVAGFRLTQHDEAGNLLRAITEPAKAADGRIAAVAALAARFVAAARAGEACRPGLDAGVRVQDLMAAVVDCAALERAVR